MSALSEYYLGSKSSVIQYELFEISHPAFTRIYRLVRNNCNGLNVTIDGTPQQFAYYPLAITTLGNRADLDSGFRIDFGDLGQVIPFEIDAVLLADAADIKPVVRYWTYRSDDLTQPVIGPLFLECKIFSFAAEGASFEAKAPSLNINRTGELYSLTRFPSLRGFVR